MKYFEDFVCGESWIVGEHLLSEDEIIAYTNIWGPKLFCSDHQLTAQTSINGLVAAGTHLMAVAVRKLVEQQPPVAIIAGLGWNEVYFWAPGRPGDRLRLECKYIEVSPSSFRDDRGVIRSRIKLVNQEGVLLLSYVDAILVSRRTAE